MGNLHNNTYRGPLAHLEIDVLLRKYPLALPAAIVALPVLAYEKVLSYDLPFSNTSVYELRRVLQAPTSYWKTTTPVLGYMGSLSIF